MATKDAIIFIDDDNDDLEIFQEACRDLGLQNEILQFETGSLFLEYLRSSRESPFIIFSDYNLPKMNGVEIRKALLKDPHLSLKSVPFVIWTTGPRKAQIDQAYENMVQGFFTKPDDYTALKKLITMILEYWHTSHHPSNKQI